MRIVLKNISIIYQKHRHLFKNDKHRFYSAKLIWFQEEEMSGKWGSNPRPSAWEANALPTELLPLIKSKEHPVSAQLVLTLQAGSSLK